MPITPADIQAARANLGMKPSSSAATTSPDQVSTLKGPQLADYYKSLSTSAQPSVKVPDILNKPLQANTDISKLSQIPGELGKTGVNFATFPLRVAKMVGIDIPKGGYDLLKESSQRQGGIAGGANEAVGNLSEGLASTEGAMLHPFAQMGQAMVGAVSKAISKLIGHPFDPEMEKVFDDAVSKVSSPEKTLDTATGMAQAVHKFLVENPDQTMLLLEGMNKSINQTRGSSLPAEDAQKLKEGFGPGGDVDNLEHSYDSMVGDNAIHDQNIKTAIQLRNTELQHAGDKVLTNEELKGMFVPQEETGASQMIFKDPTTKVYTPEAATQIVNDAKEYLTANGHPELGTKLEGMLDVNNLKAGDVLKAANGLIDGKTSVDVVSSLARKTGIPQVAEKVGGAVSSAASSVASGVSTVIKKLGRPSQFLDDAQNYLARKNAPENLEASIKRLSEPSQTVESGKGGTSDPLKTYNEFYDQEQKFKGDIKQDTALGKVGERIGNAYDDVVKMRRTAGKTMSTELKKIGDIKTDVTDAQTAFGDSLRENGAEYDRLGGLTGKPGTMSLSGSSKITDYDAKLLSKYTSSLDKLGDDPTVKELDAFISRESENLNLYKATNNVTDVTNGERIIKGNLNELRKTLTPDANPAFKGYASAKADYASLSGFLDEGSGYLGKLTTSGDFAKDASIAKSAVQSILNGGKKDWLLKLEDLTGYKAVDESMLALQAMKDSGNFRGASLLDLLSPEEGMPKIPTSLASLRDKIIGKGVEYAKDAFVGSSAEQTRRVIQGIMDSGKTEIPSKI